MKILKQINRIKFINLKRGYFMLKAWKISISMWLICLLDCFKDKKLIAEQKIACPEESCNRVHFSQKFRSECSRFFCLKIEIWLQVRKLLMDEFLWITLYTYTDKASCKYRPIIWYKILCVIYNSIKTIWKRMHAYIRYI